MEQIIQLPVIFHYVKGGRFICSNILSGDY
jgi:hypothetical protein